MSEVKASGSVASYTGLLFQLAGKVTAEYILDELWLQTKEAAVKKIEEMGGWPYVVVMPCGQYFRFEAAEDVLDLLPSDVPCPCGDPGHYIIRFLDLRDEW